MKKLYLLILLLVASYIYPQVIITDIMTPIKNEDAILNKVFTPKTFSTTSSIGNQQLSDGFELYPNPVKNGLLSILSKSNTIKNISIYDVIGKQVYQKKTTAIQINVSNLKSGLYFVKVVQDGKIATRKLVVE